MVKLSVNINKIATLRNSRGHDVPNVLQSALDIEQFGADGITVHPRPDQRHIRYSDVADLSAKLKTEFNMEGNPKISSFVDLVLKNKPTQVTLVPDSEGQLTSDHGWDTHKHQDYLKDIISVFKNAGIRTSIFIDPDVEKIEAAAQTGTDRIELYTEHYARLFQTDSQKAITPFISAAHCALQCGMGINAGHDLNLQNLKFFKDNIPGLQEVSIGHALISDALYFGLENTVQLYKRCLV